jgi:hypothetical protein
MLDAMIELMLSAAPVANAVTGSAARASSPGRFRA